MGFCRFAGNGIKSVERIGHAHVAQLAERVLGKDEVISSTLIMGSRQKCLKFERKINNDINAGDSNG